MASAGKAPIFAPILLLLAGVGLLVLPSFAGPLLVGNGEYVCGIAYLVCGASWFVLQEHQKIGLAFGGVLVTGILLVWAGLETPQVSFPLAVPGVFTPLWGLNNAIRKAKQEASPSLKLRQGRFVGRCAAGPLWPSGVASSARKRGRAHAFGVVSFRWPEVLPR